MVGTPDQATLTSLTSPLLSYGHSGGKVDTQASFIGALMDKSSDFVSISRPTRPSASRATWPWCATPGRRHQ